MVNDAPVKNVTLELRTQGYSVVRGDRLDVDSAARAYESTLTAEWDNLELDNYLKDGARFRERRYGRFYYVPSTGVIRLLGHTPYFQSTTANSYAGGIDRVVAQVTASSAENPLMRELIEFDFRQFPADPELRDKPWHVACHQFRIIANADEAGDPTPEGVHRDEIDFGAIHLMSRTNTEGGYSRIYDNSRNMVAEFRLESLMDTLFWADRDVLHSVTPITAADPTRPAVRDILILGYTCMPDLTEND